MIPVREAPASYAELVAAGGSRRVRVDVWRGDELLAEDVPVESGELVETLDGNVPEAVTLNVPARDPRTGRSWVPAAPLDPLNSYGQRLHVTYLAGRPDGLGEVAIPLGWYLIDSWEADQWTVTVTGAGLLALVETDKLEQPTSPPAGATFQSEVRRLLNNTLPLRFADGLPANRAVPRALAWQDERLGAIRELLDAWPADCYVSESGELTIVPVPETAGPAELTWILGAEYAGVVLDNNSSGGREGVYNAVTARGEQSDDPERPPVQATVYDLDPDSPTYAGGPYGIVSRAFASPLLLNVPQCQAAARSILQRSLVRADAFPVSALPDARIRPGVRVDYHRDVNVTDPPLACRVQSTRLPFTAAGGAMAVELGVIR